MITREYGLQTAEFFVNNHEYYSLKERNGWITSEKSGVVTTKMNQATLMDLWNNQVGRTLSAEASLSHLDYEELFNYAVKHDMLILDAAGTYEFYGVSDYINTSDWTVNVRWDLKNGNLIFIKEGLPALTLKIGE